MSGASPVSLNTYNRFLEAHLVYIREQVSLNVQIYFRGCSPEILKWLIDDIMQELLIKLWQTLQRQTIENPRAYIRIAARHETISHQRKRKPVYRLHTDDNGEIYQGNLIGHYNSIEPDPGEIVEQEENLQQFLEALIDAIQKLPPIQRKAMLCSLKTRIDNPIPLREACNKHNINLDAIHWPANPRELQKIRASVTIARKKLRLVPALAGS
ncbi:DNA-directed RNA polymerase specialized sigma24 family protein [Thermosporothrix hazakensis]|uniref:DNA-directed RNA polymerase specialized sigma24 family protein n=2 Tax=Thermosporothrix TaxID=768650 RepID=A0A326U2N9_THEHA|nr:sigma factor [Thermosporothrix hazakensis]PZW25712.1 DNA-directed RNA polymerase specialized sigma24 family protein [Thermosporothrix hazakensis]BBH90006.1 hypothetical protein KTC_47570 [Thermosporothrix sp. COM3]GCE48207.1 hypothetical protein KTH_30760 [Thermosporothrix hazakensis]